MIQPVWSNFFKKSDKLIIEYLKEVPVFEGLSVAELRKVESFIYKRKFVKNEFVFHQNEPGAGMYIIIKGKVKIALETPEGLQELAVLNNGDFFGDMSLLDKSSRSAAAIADADEVILLSFFRGDLKAIIQEHSGLGAKILWNVGTVLAERLRKNNELLNQKKNVSE